MPRSPLSQEYRKEKVMEGKKSRQKLRRDRWDARVVGRRGLQQVN